MARQGRRLNPEDVRKLGRDVDDIIQGSGTAIDTTYEEYKQVQRDLNYYEDIESNLRENDQTVPRKLRANIAENKIRLRELDRRIAQYGKLMIRRIKQRMDIVRNSPGAAFNQKQIRDIDRAIFKVEEKAKIKGADVRMDISSLMGAVVTLEQESGIVIRKPGKKIDEKSRRKAEEANLYAALADQWKRVHRHAKKDERVQEDIEWVKTQLRSLDLKFRRGESIRRGIERVTKRIKDIHNRTKPRKKLKTFADAQKGIRDFVVAIREYSQDKVTSAGIDRLERELADFAAQFSPKEKAEWASGELREFGRDVRNLRKALEQMRPKRGRKKNPCVGLHFHGKDTDELLKAFEKSAERVEESPKLKRLAAKSNPKKKTSKKKAAGKTTSAATLIRRCQNLWDTYCEKPTKKNLRAVLEHLEEMKGSSAKSVKSERSRCLRVANKEAKRLKVK